MKQKHQLPRYGVLFLCCWCVTVGCGDENGDTTECTPNSIDTCPCVSGQTGIKTCNENGAWGDCDCDEIDTDSESETATGGDGDSDTDTDGDSDSDSESDTEDLTVIEWKEHLITDSFTGAVSVTAADINGDGHLDLVGAAASADRISWWENSAGDGSIWVEHVVENNFDSASAAHAADIDNDGDMDIVGAAMLGDSIAWWENRRNDGTDWEKHPVVDKDFYGVSGLFPADLDADGDPDLVSAAYFAKEITWWENTEGNGSRWTAFPIAGDVAGARFVFAEDFSGDGEWDVVGAAEEGNGVYWWENHILSGGEWLSHTVTESFLGAVTAVGADINGDQQVDIVAAAREAGQISWWENPAATGHRQWLEHSVNENFAGAAFVSAADLDGDGAIDLLGAAATAEKMVWWRNAEGSGARWVEYLVAENLPGAAAIGAADLNGDQRLDLFGAATTANAILWWRNDSAQSK